MSAAGGCECRGVRYAIAGPLREVVACHCSQCRRTSGNFVADTRVLTADLTLTASDTLLWYRSSEQAERGFCGRCGGNLFFRRITGEHKWTSVTAGSLDPPTHVRLARHIFVADKSDFYDIADGLPQHARWPEQ